jgi:hypothetical protein
MVMQLVLLKTTTATGTMLTGLIQAIREMEIKRLILPALSMMKARRNSNKSSFIFLAGLIPAFFL